MELMAARVLPWGVGDYTPRARLVRRLGAAGNIEAETAALLAMNGIEDRPCPESIVAELRSVPSTISQVRLSLTLSVNRV
jgi:exoribonuclease R